MELVKRICLFLVGLVVTTDNPVLAKLEYLDTVYWSGVAFYIPVSRQVLQDKLDNFNDNNSGLRLYLPDASPLSDLPEDTLPLYIDFGNITFPDAVQTEAGEYIDITLYNVEVTVSIPFLSLHPGGAQSASLHVAVFYHPSDGSSFPEYSLVPYTAVDNIEDNGSEFIVKNGDDEIRIKYAMSRPCISIDPDITDEFEKYINEDINFSPVPPTYSYCNQTPMDGRFCQKVEAIRDGVLEAFPNVCENWNSKDGRSCEASVEVIRITEGFWDAIPVTQAEGIQVVEAEGYIGHFDSTIKYPCIEQKHRIEKLKEFKWLKRRVT